MMRSTLALLFSLLLWPASAQLSGGLMFPGPGTPHGPPPPSIAFQALTNNTTTQTTYTFSGAALGTADPTRKILVCVMGSNGGLSAPTVTVAGSSAAVQASVVGGSNATAALYSVAVASGTTGSVVVTWSASQVRTSIAVWASYNVTSGTAVASATSAVATANLNLNLLAGDIVALCGVSGTATGSTATGYTSRFNQADTAGEWYSGGDFTETVNESPRTLTLTFTGGSTIFASVSANFR